MPGSRLFLIGFSGAGKSAVGRRAAALLGWEFADTDEAIVEADGRPIPRIFAEEGEAGFRRLEQDALRRVLDRERVVVSTGGGLPLDAKNRRLMESAGLVVALDARAETIEARLAAASADAQGGARAESMARPMLRPGQGESAVERIAALKRERQWAYALAAWTIQTDALSIEQAAHEAARAWRRFGAAALHGGEASVAAVVVGGEAAYPVVVGWDILEAQAGQRFIDAGLRGRAYLICDQNVLHPYGRLVQRSLTAAGVEAHLFTFPPGEESKSLAMAARVYEWLAEMRAERRAAIVAVGGGVAGDLAGFAAATYLRGMPVVHAPTTLTAMVDSSIGGKTAVDLDAGKNLVGAFHQPALVLADVSALTTLPPRELREGWAEALKHGLALDAALVDLYESQADALLALEPELTTEVVARNAAVKARVVTQDERETGGVRTLLNYGHTIGHAIEAASGYGRYLHGEAVAVGMTGAARIGAAHGVTPADAVERQQALLRRFGLPSTYDGVDPAAILEAMTRDKKVSAGAVSWVLLDGVGQASIRRNVDAGMVREVVEGLRAG